MAAVIVAGIGVGVSAILSINNTLMARKGANSARSVGVILRNLTGRTIYLKHSALQHGFWTQASPLPSSIPGDAAAGWMSESQGFMTGTEGDVHFSFDSPGNDAAIFLHWNNPFVGSNSYSASVGDGAYKIVYENGDGDNANIIYTLSKN
ncbi:hypothetical protein CKM354_001117000 [Cercospora kikuchii]|uniref:Uncharacterized protein n=1 Tax=Cercospora kikuchii TaxID=84275 RepID=A0A9P3CV18_9PEZI|nr:uncharacterized protein CKM354_001117000 [Cercospora kikuchii]GIZ48097.1 hypothetical protein CKM354_001117000 [Cercospora kikuchii]